MKEWVTEFFGTFRNRKIDPKLGESHASIINKSIFYDRHRVKLSLLSLELSFSIIAVILTNLYFVTIQNYGH